MFNSIRNKISTYHRQLPNNILVAAIKSAVISCGFTAVWTRNLPLALTMAAWAPLVSIISGLTMPFFREAFAKNNKFKWYHKAVTMVISIGIAQFLINAFTSHRFSALAPYRVNLVAHAFFSVTLSLLVSGFKRDNSFTKHRADKSDEFVLVV